MAKKSDLAEVKRMQKSFDKLRAEIGKVIVGQEDVVEQLLIAIFARGHCIIEGVPGLAKTLLIRTLADCLRLDFNRIQFTPDLMPTDITGTEVIHESAGGREREYRFLKGPIFANIILADEINRTPDGFLERSTLARFMRCNWSQILRGIAINSSLTADEAMVRLHICWIKRYIVYRTAGLEYDQLPIK